MNEESQLLHEIWYLVSLTAWSYAMLYLFIVCLVFYEQLLKLVVWTLWSVANFT
jgi:hypothetical protein